MIYIDITNFVQINSLGKYHSLIETRRLENVVTFFQTILGFAPSRKIINMFNDIVLKYVNLNIYLQNDHLREKIFFGKKQYKEHKASKK